jgi:TonB family protein
MGHEPARWLAAAALDRHLLSTGEPQQYGTQFQIRDSTWYLSPIDTAAVSDAERRRAGARTLDEIRAYLARQNGTAMGSLVPPPKVEHAHEPTVELIGGLDKLVEQIEYPEAARAAGIEGRVRVQLVVLPDGSVGEAFVVEGLGHGLDEEALRVVRQARFVNHIGESWEIRLALPFSL